MWLLTLIVFILILGVIVLVHELGHFLWAKKFGVFIHEFSIGMGPVIYSKRGKKDGILYWQGKEMNRFSKEYDDFLDELYVSAISNPLYRGMLKNIDKYILHSMGKKNKEETVFTRYEFERMLNSLKEYIKING